MSDSPPNLPPLPLHCDEAKGDHGGCTWSVDEACACDCVGCAAWWRQARHTCGTAWEISRGPGRIVGPIARSITGVHVPLPDDFEFEYCPKCNQRNMTPELTERFLAVENAAEERKRAGDPKVPAVACSHEPDARGCCKHCGTWTAKRGTNDALPGPRKLPHDLEDYWRAPSGEGPLAAEWKDKPHRLVYDLIAALRQHDQRSSEATPVGPAEKATKAFLAAVHDGDPCPFCGAKTVNVWPFAMHERGCVIGGLADHANIGAGGGDEEGNTCGDRNVDDTTCILVRDHDGNHYDGLGYWAGRRVAADAPGDVREAARAWLVAEGINTSQSRFDSLIALLATRRPAEATLGEPGKATLRAMRQQMADIECALGLVEGAGQEHILRAIGELYAQRRERDTNQEDRHIAAGVRTMQVEIDRLQVENGRLRHAVDAAMAMYAACPADPDATQKYEAAVDTFVDALARAGLRMPASLPSSRDAQPEGAKEKG